MRRALLIVGLATLFTLPVVSEAQKSLSFGASGGASVPMGDLADGADMGFSVAGHLYVKPASQSKLGFRGDVSYDRWGAKGVGNLDGGSASLSSMGFIANVIIHAGDDKSSMHPYLVAGGGMHRSKASVSVLGLAASATSTDPAIQVGAGLEFKLSGFSTFLEGKFVNVFGDGSSSRFIPITFGVRF